jgi:hypothetical protein
MEGREGGRRESRSTSEERTEGRKCQLHRNDEEGRKEGRKEGITKHGGGTEGREGGRNYER